MTTKTKKKKVNREIVSEGERNQHLPNCSRCVFGGLLKIIDVSQCGLVTTINHKQREN